jgi:hypothetical protein
MRPILIGFAVLLTLFALGWVIQGNDFFMYQFFAPKYENVRREVFENTQSYVESKRQDLVKYRLEYMRAKTDEEKAALKFTIVQEFANFDEVKLTSPELRDFLRQMKYE